MLLLSPVRGQDPVSHQKRAAAALRYELVQMGNDCNQAKNTVEINSCLSAVAKKTQDNFHAFYESLRSLLSLRPEAVRRIDSSQDLWEKYSNSACDAIDTFYRDGSIRVSAVIGCHIQLTRSRMQDLDALYNTTLHH